MGEQTELPPFPTQGVKLKVFLDFVEEMGGRQVFFKTVNDSKGSLLTQMKKLCPCFSRHSQVVATLPFTTTDVCNMFLKEVTCEKDQSYCEYLAGWQWTRHILRETRVRPNQGYPLPRQISSLTYRRYGNAVWNRSIAHGRNWNGG